ncbi:hypothetical protein D9M72_452850 [compost metagenome]
MTRWIQWQRQCRPASDTELPSELPRRAAVEKRLRQRCTDSPFVLRVRIVAQLLVHDRAQGQDIFRLAQALLGVAQPCQDDEDFAAEFECVQCQLLPADGCADRLFVQLEGAELQLVLRICHICLGPFGNIDRRLFRALDSLDRRCLS